MQIKEFLDSVCEQIKYKPIRENIAEELKNHIEESKENYMREGLEETIAEEKAIEQMGEAQEIGKKLNKITLIQELQQKIAKEEGLSSYSQIQQGYEIVDAEKKADVYVINSCTVTATSDQKSRKAVSHFKKKNPDAVVALMGCYPQAFPEKAEKLASCDIVIGNKDKKRIVSLVESFLNEKNKITSVIEHPKTAEFEKMCISNFEERNRAFIKIQDGCNRFCSYCIIPKARGRICSKPIEEIINEVKGLVLNGYTEFVLVGIDLSSYGKEFSKTLTDAVEAVSAIEGVKHGLDLNAVPNLQLGER